MFQTLVTVSSILIIGCHAVPQDLVFDVAEYIEVGNRGSFGVIVTPEPNAVTLKPQPANIPARDECYCVPYDKCENNRRTTDQNTELKTEISFYNSTCGHYLDVCCGAGQVNTPSQPNNEQPPQIDPVQPNIPPVQPPPPTSQPTATPYRPQGCGIRNVGGIDFVINDIENKYAGFGEFNWVVAIIDTQSNICECAGSLIHPSIVLTASHCVKTQQVGQLKVRAGEWDTQTSKERLPYQERIVSQIVQHPNYNNRALYYDVAVVTVETPFTLDQHIGTVCLPPLHFQSQGQECFAAGWGKDQFGKSGIYSVIMKKVPLPIVENKECQRRLRQTRLSQRFLLHPSFTCAGGEIGIDTCEGDGGAPLACPLSDASGVTRYVQTGIVAWGIGCNTEVPAVYANVAYVREWIDKTVAKLGYQLDA